MLEPGSIGMEEYNEKLSLEDQPNNSKKKGSKRRRNKGKKCIWRNLGIKWRVTRLGKKDQWNFFFLRQIRAINILRNDALSAPLYVP